MLPKAKLDPITVVCYPLSEDCLNRAVHNTE
jgi:hypothetical protein